MKNWLLLLAVLYFAIPVLSQKPSITHEVYDGWESINENQVSDDGKYIIYSIGAQSGNTTLVVQSADLVYKRQFPGARNAKISNDGRFLLFIIYGRSSLSPTHPQKDSLVILELGKYQESKIDGVLSYKLIDQGKNTWLAYQLSSDTPNNLSGEKLIIRNLHKASEYYFDNCKDYVFNQPGSSLLLKLNTDCLVVFNLTNQKTDTILDNSTDPRNFVFDESGKQLIFLAIDDTTKGNKNYSLYYYKYGREKALVCIRSDNIEKGFKLNENIPPAFTHQGDKFFFSITSNTNPLPKEDSKEIWQYDEDVLPPQKAAEWFYGPKTYICLFNLKNDSIIRLDKLQSERLIYNNQHAGNHVLIVSPKNNLVSEQWLGASCSEYNAYLVSLLDGSRKLIQSNKRDPFYFSLANKYVIWFDPVRKHYFSYNISNSIITCITEKINYSLSDDEDDKPIDPWSFGIAGWTGGDKYILIYDRYDVWKVDPEGKQQPVNITNGYGRKNNTVLRFLRIDNNGPTVSLDKPLFLSSFNRTNKYSGFFSLLPAKKNGPSLLSSGPYSYNIPGQMSNAGVQKVKNSPVYLIKRTSEKESGDIFITKDFSAFNRISSINLHQKNYNWLSSQLIKWNLPDGRQAEGILYTPENFDSTKKYPVIFTVYEKKADDLYHYNEPAPSSSDINIPYFVSNGYLVFIPDIYYTIGHPGESAVNSVISAANYLSKMNWVDSAKLGIQGHSFGGYEVSYLITKTNIFKCAVACALQVNMVSGYGEMRSDAGISRQFQYEHGQNRIGATLWERPDLYILNSPIFNTDKIRTPLLMMHNKNDGSVPFSQAVQLFMALRRLDKKAWLLEYKGEDHFIMQPSNQKDFSIKLAQFFDHYLKECPAPVWMTKNGM